VSTSIAQQEKARPAPWAPPVWDEERIALAKKMVCPPGTTDTEFEMFVAWCRRTGLDPFIRQAFLVERRAKDASGNWVTRQEPMAAEAGLASVADAQADFRGVKAAAVYAGDEFAVDEVSQTITHRWSVEARAKAGNRVIGAWAHARREGRDVPLVWLPLETRLQKTRDGQPTQFWARDPAGMIAKCARAMAYRLAYPSLFSGVVIQEEAVAELEVTESQATSPSTAAPATTATQRLAARLGVRASTPAPSPAPAPAAQDAQPQKEETDESRPVPPPPQPPSPPRAGLTVAPITHLRFGPRKGTPLAEATTVDLLAALDVARAAVARAHGDEAWLEPTREGIAAVERELADREAALEAEQGTADE
jgi:phage recombination protein Bet